MSDAIKTMKLYVQVERVFNELHELGIADDDSVEVDLLTRFDQYHYEGVDAVDAAIQRCQIATGQHVVEVGAGIGGPARYLAHKTGCMVTAYELQADLNTVGLQLTERTGLTNLVSHRQGDFLASQPREPLADAVVSWLAFLHIPDRTRLLERCFAHLKLGGKIFIEDFSKLHPFTERERHDLETKIYCSYLPTPDEYIAQLAAAGFVRIHLEDMTASWTRFVRSRLDAFRASQERQLRVHGEAVVAGLDDFYATMTSLYEGGNLGGARITARKP